MRFSFPHCLLGSSLVLGALYCGPLSSTARADDITAVPIVLSQPGTYTLTADIIYPGGGPAIFISADDVTVDLGGHTLTATFFAAYGIEVNGVSRIRITNGTLTGWGAPVTLEDVSDSTVEGLTVNDAPSGTGITAIGGSRNTIQDNTVIDIGNSGIGLSNSSQNVVQRNTITGCGFGIRLGSATGNHLKDNTITATFSGGLTAGIQLIQSSDGNHIQHCNVSNNGNEVGIQLQESGGNFLQDNICNSNAQGITLLGSDENTLQGNTTNFNNDTGIYLAGGDDNTVKNNTANNNATSGILAQSSSGNMLRKNDASNNSIYDLFDTTCTNTWKNNHFVTKNGACIQ